MSFESSIRDIRQNRPQVYKTLTLDLSTARSEYELPIAGNYLVVIDATDLNANIQLRFNEVAADTLTLKKRQGWKIPFYRLYISNAAQVGLSITLAYGLSETPLERIDQSSVFSIQSIADPVSVLPEGLHNRVHYNTNLPASTALTLVSSHTVPAGKSALITHYAMGLGITPIAGQETVQLYARGAMIDRLVSDVAFNATDRCGAVGIKVLAGETIEVYGSNIDATSARMFLGSIDFLEY